MASVITKKQMKKEEPVPYEFVRDDLKTGDIIFCSGSYLFSAGIQKLTRSPWSHVGIIYKDVELKRVMVLEAEPYVGIRLMPVSKYLKDYKGTNKPYKGNVYVASLDQPIAKEELNKAISFGLDELTRPYDNWEIFRILTRILFKIGKRERNRHYICSELVRDCFHKAGVRFNYTDSYISPQSIWEDQRVVKKYRIL